MSVVTIEVTHKEIIEADTKWLDHWIAKTVNDRLRKKGLPCVSRFLTSYWWTKRIVTKYKSVSCADHWNTRNRVFYFER